MVVIFDTNHVERSDRLEAFRTVMIRATAPHETRFLGQDEAFAVIDHTVLDSQVSLMRQESSGIVHAREGRQLRRSGPGRIAFVLHDGGFGQYEFLGRSRPLVRGSLYVTDLNASYRYSRPGSGAACIVQIEQDRLAVPVDRIHSADPRLASSPFYDLVCQHIALSCRDAVRLGAVPQSEALAEATAQLLRALLLTTTDADAPEYRAALQEQMLSRLVFYVRTHFRDPELSPGRIAAEHAISVRYLYALWSSRPESLQDMISRLRLEAAQRLLLTDPLAPVASVLRRCGFVSPSHFSRRFREEFGCTPTEWRRLHEGTPVTGH